MKVFIILSIALFSCRTVKWKKKYINHNLAILQEKYPVENEWEFKIDSNQFVFKPYRKLRKRDLKKNVAGWEKVFALIPDSVKSGEKITDSFYINKNKIIYIKKNKMVSDNIHLIE